MSKDFSGKIKRLEAEIEELKAVARRSSSELGTVTKKITLQYTFQKSVDYEGNVFAYSNEKYGLDITSDDEFIIACCSIVGSSQSRSIAILTRLNSSGDYQFYTTVSRGNAQDISGAGSSTYSISITYSITATSDFNITVVTG